MPLCLSPSRARGIVSRPGQPIFDDMMANEQTSVSRVADREKLPLLLDKARQFAEQYIDSLEERPVFPGEKSLRAMHALVEPLPENPSDPFLVLDQLQQIGAPAVVTQTAGRYFGFVNGGILPVGLAARWMADVWDQNTAHYVMSPINSRLEEICERWIVSLLGFSEETAAGFVSGTTIANFSGLCAGRNELLRRRGWDVSRKGLYGAPKIRVVASADAHAAVHKSISMLGLGSDNVELVPVDDQGRMRADQMPKLDEAALVVTQAGNVNSGAIDPIGSDFANTRTLRVRGFMSTAHSAFGRACCHRCAKLAMALKWRTPGRSTHTRPSMFPTTAVSFSAGIAKH